MRLRWCCVGHVGKRMNCGYKALVVLCWACVRMSCGYEAQVVLCWACGEEDELWLQGSSGVVLGMWGRE